MAKQVVARGNPREAVSAVLEFQSPTAAILATPVPASARGTIWVVTSLVAACGAAAGLIPIDKVVTAQGRLVSTASTMVVQPLETSIVRSIDVHEGQVVHAGDLLARLDPTFSTADVSSYEAQVASLAAEVERMRAETGDKPYRPADASAVSQLQAALYAQHLAEHSFHMENYRQKIDSLQATARRAQGDYTHYQERLKVATEVEQKRKELERLQVGSQLNRLEATDNRLEVDRGLASAQSTLLGAVRDLQAMIAERDAYDNQWHADAAHDLTEQDRKLSDAREQLAKAQLRRRLVELRADQDAVVLTVAKVSVGSVLQSGDQFLTLVPANAPLEAEVNVVGSDAGFVHPGNTVQVKFDTFPYVHYGYAEGTVRVVSPDSFSPSDSAAGPRPNQSQTQAQAQAGALGTFYRSRVQLDQVKLHDTPAGFHLTPGMPVTADIKVGKRTVLTYMLSRVLPVAMDGMREP